MTREQAFVRGRRIGAPLGGLAVLVLLAGILSAVSQESKYTIRIGSASGEADALTSSDRDHIETIVTAMNKATVERG